MKTVITAWFGIMLLLSTAAASDLKAPLMSKEQLKSMLGDPNVIVVDVRIGYDWKESDSKIKGAIRENPAQLSSWLHKYPKGKTIVLYCA
jgi:rhodanese-related sulfurtransferase